MKKFCRILESMLKDEENAKDEYNILLKHAKKASTKTKKTIKNIRNDELKHYELLMEIFAKECKERR